MEMEKPSKYTVYRMTVKAAMEMLQRGIAQDPHFASRPISFYFNDQFTYPPERLACPPSSDARPPQPPSAQPPSTQTPSAQPPATATQTPSTQPPSTQTPATAAQPPSTQTPAPAAGSPGPAAHGPGVGPDSERPTKEAERGVSLWDLPMGSISKIADPRVRQEVMKRRALDIGNRKRGTWTDLVALVGAEFPEVRRLAASAMKKRLLVDASVGRLFFRPLVNALVRENHPQNQQYMLSAMKQCAQSLDQESADYLKDVARDPTLPLHFRNAANQIVYDFESHKKLKESIHRHWCHRCKKPITKEESAAGIEKYGKPYCKRCFDERALGDVNFEKMVDAAKNRRTLDGVAVQSRGEKRIADWLTRHHLPYEYDERFRIVEDTTIRPDFYLREFDLYIEYWGMNTDRYNANRRKKHELYQREGRKLISLSFEDDPHLEEKLLERLSLQIPALTQIKNP